MMNSSASSSASLEEVGRIGPAEDVYQALVEHLVAPFLPLKSSGKHIPSISEQQAVAKQMHAVVLLYNYYHRKHHPALELLGFESCCKLAVILKPTLMAHMKLMHRSDYTEVGDLESQLSLTEKAIMDACDISSALDATKDVPGMDGWPISKVTVLLVDSRKENCLLLFSSITSGIWSVIEKEVDASNINPGSSVNQKSTSYRRKASRMLHRDELHTYEEALQQLAISAVEEITGINQSHLMVLESHIVYSLSKEKTAARFVIVQSSQLISEDLQVPVKDLIESLQGPLVQKSSCGWRVTPVIEYFHVLPYAGILSDWISRELSSKSLGEKIKIKNVDIGSSYKAEGQQMDEVNEDGNISNEDFGVTDAIGNEAFTGNSESPKQKDSKGGLTTCLSNSGRPVKLDVDNSSLVGIQNEDKIKDTFSAVTVHDHEKKAANSVDSDKNASTRSISNKNIGGSSEYPKEKNNNGCQMACFSNSGNGTIDVDNSLLVRTHNEYKIKDTSNAVKINNHKKKKTASMDIDKDAATSGVKSTAETIDLPMGFRITENPAELNIQNKNCRTSLSGGDFKALGDRSFVPHQLNSKYTEKRMVIQPSKENALSQTALKVLLQKREKLSLKQRSLEDELALCDKHIHKLLNGGEDDLALKIQAMIDGCNDVCLKGESEPQDKACQRFEEQAALCTKRKRLSDAILTVQTPCQELDAICCMNNWILPTYSLSPSNEGFLARINVKGMDFDLSEQSDLKSSPHTARESAAAKIIAKLKGIA